MKSSKTKSLLLGSLLASYTGFAPLIGWAYSEDTGVEGAHSSFHYDLTRTLARASGFNRAQATRIAEADQATDTFPNDPSDCATAPVAAQGEITIIGTVRSHDESQSAQTHYFHWPRRGVDSVIDASAYPGSGADSCGYFTGTDQACGSSGPEIDQLERFAIAGDSTALTITTPCYSENGSQYADIPAGSLVALGVYLHSLADSYSHEACMATGKRTHQDSEVVECASFDWHIIQEYGADGLGVEYTRSAALAMWEALKRYRVNQGYSAQTSWTDQEAEQFINNWVQLNTAQERTEAANTAYENIPR